jgi:2-phosphosulfolactate phosphatase
MVDARFVDLDGAAPDEAVVVVDVLRAFTTVPWLLHRGAARVLAVSSRDHARRLKELHLPSALLAGEHGGVKVEDFDLGNSPSALVDRDLAGAEVLLRTSAGTRGLVRCADSKLLLAASFTVAGATVRALRHAGVSSVSYVITGASLGRDGDEDLACAEFIAASLEGLAPDPAPYLERVRASDAGRSFAPDGADWAPPEDLALACEVDRFATPLRAVRADDVDAIDVTAPD